MNVNEKKIKEAKIRMVRTLHKVILITTNKKDKEIHKMQVFDVSHGHLDGNMEAYLAGSMKAKRSDYE